MNEKIPTKPTPEELKQKEEEEMLQAYLNEHPDEVIEMRKESSPDIERLETLISSFKENFSLSELFALTTVQEAGESGLRNEAKEALKPITSLISELKDKTDITPEELDRLKAEYRQLSLAVGFLNSGRVRHE
jgi:hypothetical protein